MSQYVALRTLHRDIKIRVIDALTQSGSVLGGTYYQGNKVQLSSQADTVVDLDIAFNRIELARHSAVGQWIVSAASSTVSTLASGVTLENLPPNTGGIAPTP